jgi:siderophore synthetase component
LPESADIDERIARQLVEALLSERLVAARPSPRVEEPPGELVAFELGARSYRCRARRSAFGRVRIARGSLLAVDRAEPRRARWEELAEALPARAPIREEVAAELAATAEFSRWNAEHMAGLGERRRHGYEALEGSLHEGHPYHPCFKGRSGFSLADHRRYGPEGAQVFELEWLAVRRDELVQSQACDDMEFVSREFGASVWSEVSRAFAAKVLARDEYGVLPCHPWQAARLARLAPSALQRRSVLSLGVRAGRYRATQSLRTLMHEADPRASHVKLPLATRVSSSLRTLNPECVSAAPAVSAWLDGLVASDRYFSSVAGLTILREHASACHSFEGDPELERGHAGAIFRESVGSTLAHGEEAVPFNALFARELDGRPFIEPWVERHGLTRWLKRLLFVTVSPIWRLLVRHGVALEAHAQNLVLVHRRGVPERIAVRDFHDSVEYADDFLAEPQRLPDFPSLHPRFARAPADRYYRMSSLEELRELVTDCLFVFNLGELAALLVEAYGFPEARFWALVRGVLREVATEPDDERRAAALAFDAPLVRVESLFTRRLRGEAESRCHHLVLNPLHQSSKEHDVVARANAGDQ